ncbi:poly-beta-1,6-N-acetyl-D-glucosamine synthase [Planococcus halocryophilus]|uniref:poly-beta-1,6-N-acetyl-D-glucosamine synthase n=1 Tax=Planococcus halocryophilus TaxID=1215089 RepID=UPI001F0CF4C3|nr:poly-beta-1,6-N-acetyl-D-glucosamine synthase [Planococcus halocryophilus]MCH4825536.1 poly-beta-1,6-N-acetyl-D-glucosamine synthase [Planococcus halocryophilus]
MGISELLTGPYRFMMGFVFWYPFAMALFWIAGSLLFLKTKESKNDTLDIENFDWPMVSILVPCYNEEETVEETVRNLTNLSYPKKEILLINDGSKDKTGEIIKRLSEQHGNVRAIQLHENRGKANALQIGLFASRAEYLICVDSDALLADTTPYYLIHHFFKKGERLGAVTGNPTIRNRNNLLSRMQLVEYASIIGAIKRTQRLLGKVMTVSGVVVAFRKKALVDVGLWDRDMITEDIAVSWKLQKRFWDIRYEPRAICWMLVPETLSGIWKQRVRWAQGGQEVILRHWKILFNWQQRRLWIIYLEQWTSILWALCWLFLTLLLLFKAETLQQMLIWFTFSSFALVFISLIQLFITLLIDSRYNPKLKYYFWAAWYPALYWMINTAVVMAAIPRSISSRIKGGYATWNSPDRGIKKKVS